MPVTETSLAFGARSLKVILPSADISGDRTAGAPPRPPAPRPALGPPASGPAAPVLAGGCAQAFSPASAHNRSFRACLFCMASRLYSRFRSAAARAEPLSVPYLPDGPGGGHSVRVSDTTGGAAVFRTFARISFRPGSPSLN